MIKEFSSVVYTFGGLMGLSIFLAKWIGLYTLIMALLLTIRKQQLLNGIHALIGQPGFNILGGIINLIIGLAILIAHPVWKLNWEGLVTLIGLISLMKGIFRLGFPECMDQLTKTLIKNESAWIGMIIFSFLIGGVLTYYGFFPEGR